MSTNPTILEQIVQYTYPATLRLRFLKSNGSGREDISWATAVAIYLLAPGETVWRQKTGVLTSDGKNGEAEWIAVDATGFDLGGSWKAFGICSAPGRLLPSLVGTFYVHPLPVIIA